VICRVAHTISAAGALIEEFEINVLVYPE